MSKKKYNLNTIYISERLQENLKPISQSAFTAVTAPMGYGKTTAINWYLDKQSKNGNSCVIRISIYSDICLFSGRAFRRHLPLQGLIFWIIMFAPQMLPVPGCLLMSFVMP